MDWSVKQGPVKGYLEVRDQEGHTLAQLIPDGVAARLMAASPELLRELKHLLSMWEEAIGLEQDYMDMADGARAVIAKAEGRSE